ncbi:MAG TPA: hypothetical protein VGS41_07950 [Chthonomonadales bacterium]|nr:hypothetical protein [Chthonomonadales bacterium]
MDGQPDLIFQNPTTGDLTYWIMNGTQQAAAGALVPSNSGAVWQVVAP